MIALAITTGATDATAFERLGNAFASVITGNLVLLGVGAAGRDGRLAVLSACAIAGYAAGVVCAAPRDDQPAPAPSTWPRAATTPLIGGLTLLVVVAVGWEASDCRPGSVLQTVLLSVAAAAMGIQSTSIRRLGPISTTYLTSTFVGVFEALARRRWSHEHGRSAAILIAALGGAAAATGLIMSAPRLVPLVILAPLLSVVVVARGASKQ
ncbi:MAG: YoaK family protein [Solirubrobacteraceae bacterium]